MKAMVMTLLLVLVVGPAFGLVRTYSVEPVQASWSGWTPSQPPLNYVSQVITVAFDSLAGGYVELFGGANGGPDYQCQVFTYPGGNDVTGLIGCEYRKPYDWVRFDIDEEAVLYPDSIVKGKQLEFRFSRSGADNIEPGLDVL